MSAPRSDTNPALPRKKRLARALGASGIVLSSCFLLTWLALPAIVKSYGSTLIADKLHRHSTIGTVKFNPFTLALDIGDVKVMEPAGDTVFVALDHLRLDLAFESILRLAPVIQEVRLSKPYVHLARTGDHHYNVDDIIALASAQPPSDHPARFSINNIQIEDGRIDFNDLPKKSVHAITGIALNVPFISSMPSDVEVFVEPLLRAQVDGSPLLLKAKARPFAQPKNAVVELNVSALDITRFLAYLPFEPGFKVPSAQLDANLTASFEQPKDKSPYLALQGKAALKSLQVVARDGKPLVQLPELQVTLKNADLFNNRVDLDAVSFKGLQVNVARGPDGLLDIQRMLSSAPPQRNAPQPAAAPSPWRVSLGELQLHDGALRYADEAAARPLHAAAEKFDVVARKIALDTGKKTVQIGDLSSGKATVSAMFGKRAAPDAVAPKAVVQAAKSGAPYVVNVDRFRIDNWTAHVEDQGAKEPLKSDVTALSLSAQSFSTAPSTTTRVALKATVNRTGQLALDGTLGLAPFRADLSTNLDHVDLLPLQPLVADQLNLRLTHADLSTKGKLKLELAEGGSLRGGFTGDASLANLASFDKASDKQFLRWKSLDVAGMDVRLAPFALAIDKVALNDFFARVTIDPKGRVNLQDIVHQAAPDKGTGGLPKAGAPAPVVPAPGAQAAAHKMPPVTIRELSFRDGRVRFSDNFIKPNYSASLMQLGGTVKGLSSDPAASASVDLHGEVSGAPLSIAGRINPLRRDLLLDLKGNVRGMEMVGLSPYASKYLGYGIEKGKLSFEVAYRVENGQLTASNRLLLDQLTLSDEPSAGGGAKLPVKLALALLQDRNGVIDVNVPIEGSLNDPQFSVGGIVLKIIGNAIVKAVSQPFAALGAVFGGGSHGEMSSLPFAPGQATIPPAGEAPLTSLAKALANRPALKLEITGWADPAADTAGLKRAEVERKVRALKRQDLLARGEVGGTNTVTVTPEEYPALLARVYKEEKFQKPRNVVGFAKSLPVQEMENLIIANTSIDEEDLANLANRRAQAAKDWLIKFGQVPGERLFILAPETDPAAQGDQGAAGARSKVQFSLR